jgi:tocopherol cyclase
MLCLCLYLAIPSALPQELTKEIYYTQHNYLPYYNLKKVGNTSIFQGNKKTEKYFEGWYFKMVSKDGSSIMSVIPGISLSSDGQYKHAFIQIIDGKTSQTSYHNFSIEEFSFSKKDFAIKIADNYFSKDSLILNIIDSSIQISGRIKMDNTIDYKSGRMLNSGIMGWYRFVPFMECYHGVVSLSHNLEGVLNYNNTVFDFNNGKGYIEKDWGSSMPSAWIWMQSNHFSDTNTSFMLSIADIPWIGKSFNGFLGFLYHNNKIYHFATYRPTKLELEIADSNHIKIKIKNRKNTFILEVESNNTGVLKAPTKGAMDRRIPESIDAKIIITMLDKKGIIVFTDSSNITGLEMVGDFYSLQGLLK